MKLEAKGISVSHRGHRIVADASLSVSSGELVGLIGPNGAGKSTLLKALLGIIPKDAGSVALDGQDFFELASRVRAQRVSFLPQERRVEWRLPARDVVMLGRYPHHAGFGGSTPEDTAAVDRALADADCREISDRPVAVLSGGERTRVLLARTLAVEAPTLLADEPIAALDPYHQLHVMEILKALTRKGVGVLAIIHDLALAARFMDRLVLMHRGAVVADGAPADVLKPELLASVYRIEALAGANGGDKWVLPWSRLS
ncbi:MAG TPA: ABC transporter ATP-binding protein [Hyphomonadaceae bacterium]|jgi:iron complex transport system ATP-binding protein|nr:ABC transporter ATP-binding protein [Hyphomonadaceae bacterium]